MPQQMINPRYILLMATLTLSAGPLANSEPSSKRTLCKYERAFSQSGYLNVERPTAAKESQLIVAGTRVGLLELGDSRSRALQLYPPKPNIDKEYEYPNCGITYEWIDLNSHQGGGISIGFRNGTTSQIDATSETYRTAEGLTRFSPPERVRESYKQIKTYVIYGTASEAIGGRDLILWIQKGDGIAFIFAYDRARQSRSVYKISVFKPRTEFCPEGHSMDSPDLGELAPYSLEPPEQPNARMGHN
jgi:hypothetical protein